MNTNVTFRRQAGILARDHTRVLLRHFWPGTVKRAKSTIARVLALTASEAEAALHNATKLFEGRHAIELEHAFERHALIVSKYISRRIRLSRTRQLLLGAYFSHEYSLEAAALFNPSIVPHFDQNGVTTGSVRFILSLRATGEGHISSIEFRTGRITPDGTVSLDTPGRHVTAPGQVGIAGLNRERLRAYLLRRNLPTSLVRQLVGPLSAEPSGGELHRALARIAGKRSGTSPDISRLELELTSYIDSNYISEFPGEVPIGMRALFPISSSERNGIEDARFVRFADEKGEGTYYATYTAYDGRSITPQLLETKDFRVFRVGTLSGSCVENKGMALFPRKIGGKYVMVSRQDGEKLYLMSSQNVMHWTKKSLLLEPKHAWEAMQIGNCGSPIETPHGWILLTHGVGPMRRYCIGAVLLDLENPHKVIGRLRDPLIEPDETEREGYVPNVVYTCGAMLHAGRLIIPYAVSDFASRFGSVDVEELVGAMKPS